MHVYLSDSSKRKKGLKIRIRFYAVSVVIISLAIALAYFLKYSPVFQVTEFKISGTNKSVASAIQSLTPFLFKRRIAGFLGTDNYFFWPSGSMRAYAGWEFNIFPEFANIFIRKSFYNRGITIEAQERTPLGIWCVETSLEASSEATPENCFWFDDTDGILIEASPSSAGQLVFTVYEQGGPILVKGRSVLGKKEFSNLKSVLEALRGLSLSISRIEFQRNSYDLEVGINNAGRLFFSLRFDPQISTLPALKELLNTKPLNRIDYLDLRVENKIYLKEF